MHCKPRNKSELKNMPAGASQIFMFIEGKTAPKQFKLHFKCRDPGIHML